jgi:hypothetical protein
MMPGNRIGRMLVILIVIMISLGLVLSTVGTAFLQ